MREASNGAEPIAVVVDATARYLATEDPACLFDPSVDEAVFQLAEFETSDINFAGQAWYSLGRLFWHRSEVGPETDQEYERQMAVSYLVNALHTRIQHFDSVQDHLCSPTLSLKTL